MLALKIQWIQESHKIHIFFLSPVLPLRYFFSSGEYGGAVLHATLIGIWGLNLTINNN